MYYYYLKCIVDDTVDSLSWTSTSPSIKTDEENEQDQPLARPITLALSGKPNQVMKQEGGQQVSREKDKAPQLCCTTLLDDGILCIARERYSSAPVVWVSVWVSINFTGCSRQVSVLSLLHLAQR